MCCLAWKNRVRDTHHSSTEAFIHCVYFCSWLLSQLKGFLRVFLMIPKPTVFFFKWKGLTVMPQEAEFVEGSSHLWNTVVLPHRRLSNEVNMSPEKAVIWEVKTLLGTIWWIEQSACFITGLFAPDASVSVKWKTLSLERSAFIYDSAHTEKMMTVEHLPECSLWSF